MLMQCRLHANCYLKLDWKMLKISGILPYLVTAIAIEKDFLQHETLGAKMLRLISIIPINSTFRFDKISTV